MLCVHLINVMILSVRVAVRVADCTDQVHVTLVGLMGQCTTLLAFGNLLLW